MYVTTGEFYASREFAVDVVDQYAALVADLRAAAFRRRVFVNARAEIYSSIVV